MWFGGGRGVETVVVRESRKYAGMGASDTRSGKS